MKENTLTRQELYDLVWKEPMTAVAIRLNIPYSNLRKICSVMNIPIPLNGHWSKLKFGKPVEVIQLPQDYTGQNEINLTPGEDLITDTNPVKLYKKSAVDLIKEDKTLPLKVPNKLTNPDKLVEDAHKRLIEYKYKKYNDYGMVRSEKGGLQMRVARNNIGRALLFMDTLIKLLKARGHTVINKYDHTCAVIDGEDYEIKLMEKSKKGDPDPKWGSPTYQSSGIFYFTIEGYYGRTWTDGTVPIEEKLAEILAKLEAMAKQRKEDRRHQEDYQRVQDEKERIIRESHERIEKEKSDFKNLYIQAKRWQRAKFMRDYIKAVEEDVNLKNGNSNELQNWLKWANEKVDWYDPLINLKDEMLNDNDKNILS